MIHGQESVNSLLPASYIQSAEQSYNSARNAIGQLLSNRQLPENGFSDLQIELLLRELSLMDSNNFQHSAGAGERESRIFSCLVKQRHFHMGHGVGRSGNLCEMQPKAAGSSLMMQMTNILTLSALRCAGIRSTKACFVCPMATGMSLALSLSSLRSTRPDAKFVIWPRIDQKSCFKCIGTAGFEPVVIENRLEGDELRTDLDAIVDSITEHGSEQILCVLTTTSCFAPRACDRIVEVAKICKKYNIPHVVNNAYGVQLKKCCSLIEEASRHRVDLFLQSTDKNFMVPVGGCIVAGFDSETVNRVSQTYAGRASASPVTDLFITLLSMGKKDFLRLLDEREDRYRLLYEQLSDVAKKHGQQVLNTVNNPISIAVTLDGIDQPTRVGSSLFTRRVTGARVVSTTAETKRIGSHQFTRFGSHADNYPHSYITFAAAIGMSRDEILRAVKQFDLVLDLCEKSS